MFKKMLEYIIDNKLKILVYKDKVDVINYKEILIFDDNDIVIDCQDFILKIKGNNLIINKLMDREVLIFGDIHGVDLK